MKKITSIVLTLIMILSLLTIGIVTTNAETFTDENGIEWEVTESYPGWGIRPVDKDSLSGTVEIPSVYNGKVIIAISDSAFIDCKNVTNVIIPDSIMSIGNSAFWGAGLSGNYKIADSVQSIGSGSFCFCENLTGIELGENLVNAGGSCFANCNNLESVKWNSKLSSIPGSAFHSCTGLSGTFKIPDCVKTIGGSAFGNCTGITGFDFNNTDKIESYAFDGCTGLSGTIILPNGLKVLETGTFMDCSNMEGIVFNDGLLEIKSRAFSGCSHLSGIIDIPSSCKKIDSYVFDESSKGITQIILHEGLEYIGEHAFCRNGAEYQCGGDLIIPSTVKYVGEWAFFWLRNIENLSFAGEVEYIGQYAFPDQFNVEYSDKFWVSDGTFTDDNGIEWYYQEFEDGKIQIKPWNLEALPADYLVIPSEYNGKPITKLMDECFGEYKGLTGTVILPSNLKEIGYRAFAFCSNIKYMEIPNSVEYIGDEAFESMSSWESEINLPQNLKYLGIMAFGYCQKITGSIVIPEAITEVPNCCFEGCSSLSGDLVIPSRITRIGWNAFDKCSDLESISIENGVTEIASFAFYNCSGFDGDLVIPNSVKTIENSAFRGCSNIDTLVISNNLEEISDSCFESMYSVSEIIIPDSVKSIGRAAFRGGHTRNIDLGNSVEHIGESAFASSGITGTDLVIPSSVSYVAPYAFGYNNYINSLTLNTSNLSVLDALSFYSTRINSINFGDSFNNVDSPFLSGGQIDGEFEIGENTEITNPYAFYGNDNMTIVTKKSNNSAIDYAKTNSILLRVTDANIATHSGDHADAIVVLTVDTANLRVTVPTVLPVSVDSDNNITVADNAQIINSSRGQIDITNAVLSGSNTWELSAFNTDFTKLPVDIKQYGFKLQGYNVPVSGNAYNSQFDTIAGNASLDLSYDANVAIQSEAIKDAEIGNIVFTVAWHK